MIQTKYIVISNEAAKKCLSTEQRQWLLSILQTLANSRREAGKEPNSEYFVLQLRDQFAVPALEAYITTIQDSGLALNNKGVQAALDVATAVRQSALLHLEVHLPD